MILLTKIVNAETALAFGLVTDVVDAQTLESTLESLLQTLISIDADVYGLAKSAMRPDSSASVHEPGWRFDLSDLPNIYVAFLNFHYIFFMYVWWMPDISKACTIVLCIILLFNCNMSANR